VLGEYRPGSWIQGEDGNQAIRSEDTTREAEKGPRVWTADEISCQYLATDGRPRVAQPQIEAAIASALAAAGH
jgi:hypothetical protein